MPRKPTVHQCPTCGRKFTGRGPCYHDERTPGLVKPEKGKRPRFAVYCQGCRNRLIAPPRSGTV